MEIDKSIKVGDIVATNASNAGSFIGQRVFGEVSTIDFNGIHEGFQVDLKLNGKLFKDWTSIIAYPYHEPGRPYEDAYLVKATPEECEAHRTGVMPDEKDLWCVQVTESNVDLLNEYMKPLLEKHGKPKNWRVNQDRSSNFYFKCPELWTGSHTSLSIPQEAKLITTEEFLEKTKMKKKIEFKYRKGVWYKHNSGNSFRKCNRDSNDNIPYDERILENRYEIHSGTSYWMGVEADMNEVSKYLPDGHPDKIVEELQIGKWYRVDNFYLKLERIEGCGKHRKLYGETIDNGRYSATGYWASKYLEDAIKKDGPLKNIFEIQGYLPNDHPDKIKEKPLKASESFHDFKIGDKFKILVDRPHSSQLKKGDIVTCFRFNKNSIIVKEGGWSLSRSTIGKYYEPYYGGGGIIDLIEGLKAKDDLLLEEPKIVSPKNDIFDPIVKAPIVI